MTVDAWARSGEGGAAAQRAEALLQQMHELYQSGKHESLRPTTGMFNAVINSWARSREKIAPVRAEQILDWMQNLKDLDVQPDKYVNVISQQSPAYLNHACLTLRSSGIRSTQSSIPMQRLVELKPQARHRSYCRGCKLYTRKEMFSLSPIR